MHVDAAAVSGRVEADRAFVQLDAAGAVEIDAAAARVAIARRAGDEEIAEVDVAGAANREHRAAGIARAADGGFRGIDIDVVAVRETAFDDDILIDDVDLLAGVARIHRDPDVVRAG